MPTHPQKRKAVTQPPGQRPNKKKANSPVPVPPQTPLSKKSSSRDSIGLSPSSNGHSVSYQGRVSVSKSDLELNQILDIADPDSSASEWEHENWAKLQTVAEEWEPLIGKKITKSQTKQLEKLLEPYHCALVGEALEAQPKTLRSFCVQQTDPHVHKTMVGRAGLYGWEGEKDESRRPDLFGLITDFPLKHLDRKCSVCVSFTCEFKRPGLFFEPGGFKKALGQVNNQCDRLLEQSPYRPKVTVLISDFVQFAIAVVYRDRIENHGGPKYRRMEHTPLCTHADFGQELRNILLSFMKASPQTLTGMQGLPHQTKSGGKLFTVNFLGSGASSNVWLCQDSTGKRMAFKNFKGEEDLEREQENAELLRKLPDQKGLPALICVVVVNGLAYEPLQHFSYESWKGKSIGQAFADLVTTLERVHKGAKLVHTDIRPPNILMTEDGKSLVLNDWGFAMPIENAQTREHANQLYFPERLIGVPSAPYTASDDLVCLVKTALALTNPKILRESYLLEEVFEHPEMLKTWWKCKIDGDRLGEDLLAAAQEGKYVKLKKLFLLLNFKQTNGNPSEG